VKKGMYSSAKREQAEETKKIYPVDKEFGVTK
jgi:hypothetical protein